MTVINTKMLFPTGISLNKTQTSFRIQSRKNVMINGKRKQIPAFATVKINYPLGASADLRTKTFNFALEEAKKVKILQVETLSKGGAIIPELKKIRAVGILKSTFDALFKERWEKVETGNDTNIKIYAQDVFSYFPSDIRLDAMQTKEYYNGFVEHCKKAILRRRANHMATVSTKTINKRLGLLRDIFRYAIDSKTLAVDKLLNTQLTHMGWKNLPVKHVKRKMALNAEEERRVLDKAKELGQQDFCDALCWLNDTGMRQTTEFLRVTIDNVDLKRNLVNFYRPKTNIWTIVYLTPRAREIAVRLKDRANLREDKRMFGHFTGRSMRTLFDKYRKLCNIPDFTPYITRHTFMTKLGENKVAHPTIAKLGGVTEETAAKYYMHSTSEMEQDAMTNLNVTDMRGHNSKHRVE